MASELEPYENHLLSSFLNQGLTGQALINRVERSNQLLSVFYKQGLSGQGLIDRVERAMSAYKDPTPAVSGTPMPSVSSAPVVDLSLLQRSKTKKPVSYHDLYSSWYYLWS